MHVIATDGDADVLQLLSANAAANRSRCADEPNACGDSGVGNGGDGGVIDEATDGSLTVAPLIWGEPKCALTALGLTAPPSLILATGCVYSSDEGVWGNLVETLEQLSGPATLVVMVHGNGAAPGAQQLRGRFYELARRRFECTRVAPHHLHAQHHGCTVACLVRK